MLELMRRPSYFAIYSEAQKKRAETTPIIRRARCIATREKERARKASRLVIQSQYLPELMSDIQIVP